VIYEIGSFRWHRVCVNEWTACIAAQNWQALRPIGSSAFKNVWIFTGILRILIPNRFAFRNFEKRLLHSLCPSISLSVRNTKQPITFRQTFVKLVSAYFWKICLGHSSLVRNWEEKCALRRYVCIIVNNWLNSAFKGACFRQIVWENNKKIL